MTITADVSATTRKIKFEKARPFAVDGDFNIDKIIFKLPTDSDENIDFTSGNRIIYYSAIGGSAGSVPLTDIDDDGNPIWHCSSAVTDAGDGNVTFVLVVTETDAGGIVVKRWVSMPCTITINSREGVDIESSEEEQGEETYAQRLVTLMTQMVEMQAVVKGLASGAPKPVDEKVKMIDDGHIYLYGGDETGLVTGGIYYYVGGTLTYGWKYGIMYSAVDDGDGNITITAGGTT